MTQDTTTTAIDAPDDTAMPNYLLRLHPSDSQMEMAAKINTNFARLGGRLEPLAGGTPQPNAGAPNAPGVSHLEGSLDANARPPMRPVAGTSQAVLRGERPDNAQQAPPAGQTPVGGANVTPPAQPAPTGRETTENGAPEPAAARDRLGL